RGTAPWATGRADVPGPARCGTIDADDRPAPAVYPPPLAAVAATPGHDRPGARRRRYRPARDASRLGPSRGRGRALPPRARVVAPPPSRGDGLRPGRGRRARWPDRRRLDPLPRRAAPAADR